MDLARPEFKSYVVLSKYVQLLSASIPLSVMFISQVG